MIAPDSTAREDAALSLTVAVVASSHGPLLLLDGSLNVVVASRSFCRAFDIDPDIIVGRSLFALGGGEWNVPQLRSLLVAASADGLPIEGFEFDLVRPPAATRHLSINAERLSYLELDKVRLVVAVADLTEVRADEESRQRLSRESELLLKEVRHRIANSLQIIAGILLRGARKAHSTEARSLLQDARNRVLSVGSLERQLSTTTGDDVRIDVYLTNLCASVTESIIADADRIAIEVAADDTRVPAAFAVNLGLITTELVINALKHAFPEGRPGKITVSYTDRNGSWSLRVKDDGVGKPPDSSASTGIGASIVEALSRQFEASVETRDTHPGTEISITREAVANAMP